MHSASNKMVLALKELIASGSLTPPAVVTEQMTNKIHTNGQTGTKGQSGEKAPLGVYKAPRMIRKRRTRSL